MTWIETDKMSVREVRSAQSKTIISATTTPTITGCLLIAFERIVESPLEFAYRNPKTGERRNQFNEDRVAMDVNEPFKNGLKLSRPAAT